KDTHFEAIHNLSRWEVRRYVVVRANAKIHILKQFTTLQLYLLLLIMLYMLMQRYTF
ncbi:hypothetical protein HMPREF9148_02691, partial [Prevotella sp. F0091]